MYVALAQVSDTAIKTSVTPGDIAAVGINDNKEMFFNYVGADKTLMRSDLLKTDCIMYAKSTEADKLKLQLKSVKVELNGALVPGEVYILRINIKQAFGKGDDTTYQKFGAVKVDASMTVQQFWTAMKESLERNFSKELTKWFEFTSDATSLTITELEQDWVAGKTPKENVYFEVSNCYVKDSAGVEVEAFATTNNGRTVGTVTYTPEAHNGHIIVDQEIFYMGERGDQYRDVCGIYKINTQYLADPNKDYYTIDIHYAFVDSNEGVQKSEKDIYIVGEKAVIAALITQINAIKAGLVVKEWS